MTGMASWMSACSAPCTVMSNEPIFSSSPAATALNWSGRASSCRRSASGAYSFRSGRSASAALIASEWTWSACSWVMRMTSPPAMISAADDENEPGSMTIDVPSFSATTQACSCLVSFIGASLRPAQVDHVADGPDHRFRLVDMDVVPGVPGVDVPAGGGGGRELVLQLGPGGQGGRGAGEHGQRE